MRVAPPFSPRFVMNKIGKRTGVLLTLREYEELMGDLQDLAKIAERRQETPIPHKKVAAELKEDGYP